MRSVRTKLVPNSIREHRLRAGLKLYEVAQRLGLSGASHVAHWEKGRKIPSLENLLRLSIVLNVQVSTLYFDLWHTARKKLSMKTASPTNLPDNV